MIDDRQLVLPGIPQAHLDAAPLALCPPIIKYAGSKRWAVQLLAPRIHAILSSTAGTYIEPFCGGLAMGLAIGWPKSIYADLAPDVTNIYSSIALDADQVADELAALAARGTNEKTYYEIRREVWPRNRSSLSQFAWAARMIYLNRIGFNGLFRCNRRGEFNVPWGDREGGAMPTRDHIRKVGATIGASGVQCCDFGVVLDRLEKQEGSLDSVVVFVDPPYGATLQDSTRAGPRARKAPSDLFTGYAGAPFGRLDQVRLAVLARRLADRGACVIATNTWADAICDLYRDGFQLFPVGVRHAIGATGARRGKRLEMLAVDSAHALVFDPTGEVKIRRVK